jgi:hypothetical protein
VNSKLAGRALGCVAVDVEYRHASVLPGEVLAD